MTRGTETVLSRCCACYTVAGIMAVSSASDAVLFLFLVVVDYSLLDALEGLPCIFLMLVQVVESVRVLWCFLPLLVVLRVGSLASFLAPRFLFRAVGSLGFF